jgi:hypothetical protein
MPLELQPIDNRKYADLLEEALVRIHVHNPEWTNFNKSDPGVTIIELWAFLTESLLYRVNQIPDRNRHRGMAAYRRPHERGFRGCRTRPTTSTRHHTSYQYTLKSLCACPGVGKNQLRRWSAWYASACGCNYAR